MHKKFFKVALLFFITISPLLIAELDNSIKLKAAAFFPNSERVRSVYGSPLPAYEIETTFGIHDKSQVWFNMDWVNKHGQSERFKHFTSMNIISCSGGVSLLGQVTEGLKICIGVGYSLSYTTIHNRYTLTHRHQKKYISGLVAKSALLYDFNCHYFGEIFLDYLYQRPQFKTRVHLGGTKLGAGLGYKF